MSAPHAASPPLAADLAACLAGLELGALRQTFLAQGRVLFIEELLGPSLLDRLLETLPSLRPEVHRNYLPTHKKGGSVSRYALDRLAPLFGELYRAAPLRSFLNGLCGETLLDCPDDDPHTYALYSYTEPGDHIGWHYDTSYYRGRRYTVLLGLVDRSSCKLEYELHTRDPERPTVAGSLSVGPGTFVLFDGDALRHRITPFAAGDEERLVLTMEFVTDPAMHPWRRFVSNMKDSLAYFGFGQVFKRSR